MLKKNIDPKRSKIAKGAKKKGSKAETEIAKVLSLWFFNNTDSFHRVPTSGGLRWKKDVAKTRGDIIPSESITWPFSIEIKNQEKSNWDFIGLLKGEGPIIKWWSQCVTDALIVKKIPLLIFTRNSQPYFVMSSKTAYPLKKLPDLRFNWFDSFNTKQIVYITTLSSLLIANEDIKKYNSKDHWIETEKEDGGPIIRLIQKIIFNPSKKIKDYL